MANLKVTEEEIKDVLVRALKTFYQAFAAQLLVTNQTYGKQALVSAAAAGVSAVLNLSANRVK